MANNTYVVTLQRTINDSKLGPTVLRITVQAPDSTSAKHMAQSQAHGYKAQSAERRT